jgi:hypothetical protein
VSSIARPSQATPGYTFRGRRYAQVQIKLRSLSNDSKIVCVNTGYAISLIDRKFLRKFLPTVPISTMPTPMSVKGIREKQHNANQFAILDFYLPASDNLVAHFCREIHIVDDLDANALLGLDIAVLEGWTIDLDAQKMMLPHCSRVIIPIITCSKGPKTQALVFTAAAVKLLPNCRQIVKVSGRKGADLQLPERDFFYSS